MMTGEIVLICANICTILGVVSYIIRVCKPIIKAANELEQLKTDVDKIKEKLRNDKTSIEELADESKLQCIFMVNMADHIISGNSIDKIKETRDNILSHLAEV